MAVRRPNDTKLVHELTPLRDGENSPDPVRVLAAQLISTWEPLADSRVPKRRVRLALDRPKRRERSHWLRPALVLGLLLPAGLAAGAWGTVRLVEVASVSVQDRVPEVDGTTPVKQKASPGRSLSRIDAAPSSQPPPNGQSLSARGDVADETIPQKSHIRTATASTPKHTQSQNSASEAELVQSAVLALRTQHDPERAQALLAQYRRRNPNGSLLDEATALSIEAAMAQGDPTVRSMAKGYLMKFPNGRYRSRIQTILERASDR